MSSSSEVQLSAMHEQKKPPKAYDDASHSQSNHAALLSFQQHLGQHNSDQLQRISACSSGKKQQLEQIHIVYCVAIDKLSNTSVLKPSRLLLMSIE